MHGKGIVAIKPGDTIIVMTEGLLGDQLCLPVAG
jgi:hypothetical protein